jgi:type IV fimbrial biogenesis protein FimT
MGGRSQKGFTLLELMLTLTVVSVIVGLAIPNFREFIKNSRMTSGANDLLASMQLARSESIKRRGPVAVCPSANPRATPPACAAGFNGNGWVVWWDKDDNGVIGATEEVLGRHDALDSSLVLSQSANLTRYQPSGFTEANVTNYVLLCDDRADALVGNSYYKRAVSVSRTGRASVRRTTDEFGALAAELAVDLKCP